MHGNSLDFTYRHLLSKEPASLKICTFLDKPERRKPGITLKPDYVGYTVPNEFVVGYGLDFNEHYRNLPYIGVLKPEDDPDGEGGQLSRFWACPGCCAVLSRGACAEGPGGAESLGKLCGVQQPLHFPQEVDGAVELLAAVQLGVVEPP